MTASPAAAECDSELSRLFAAALEAIEEDLAAGVIYANPDASLIARRAAKGGTDPLSVAVTAIADRMWDQTGRRGFRGSIIRWRIAALIVLARWLPAGWLPLAVWLSLFPAPAETVPATPAAGPVMRRKLRDQLTTRPTTGPPAGAAGWPREARPGAPVIFP